MFGNGGFHSMSISLNHLISGLSLSISVPAVLYLIKVMLRTHIEVVLEDRYKNKINELIKIISVSSILAIFISMATESVVSWAISDVTRIVGIINFMIILFYLLYFVQLGCFGVNQFRKVKREKYWLMFYKINFLIQYLSMIAINVMVFIGLDETVIFQKKAMIVGIMAFNYLLIISLTKLCFSQVKQIKNNYEIRIIDENLNETLKKLILLYSLNKELLIMREKADGNKDINDLEVFYVYYLNQGCIFKYRKVK